MPPTPSPTPVLIELLQDFDGPAWATAFLSVVALGVSIWALVRTRTPRPNWELVNVEETEVEEGQPYSNALGDAVSPTVTMWSARVRQNGPGNAESISTRVKLPDGTWTPENRLELLELGRAGEFGITLCSREKVPGEYAVRISYRCLPNTRRVRAWKTKAVVV